MPKVEFSPEARADLQSLYEVIREEGGTERAGAYLDRIERRCALLAEFPLAGLARDDIAPGLRSLAFERRVLLAYRVTPSAVQILRILYAGRSFPTASGDA